MNSGAETIILGICGYALQWLRGFKWYNDGMTLLTSIVAGAAIVWLSGPGTGPTNTQVFVLSALREALTILGGTLVGHMAANSGSPIMLAPTYNQFNTPASTNTVEVKK